MEKKLFDFSSRQLDDLEGKFSGYAAIFGAVDSGGDRIIKGAFTKTLAERLQKYGSIPLAWQHVTDDPIGPLGKVTKAYEVGREQLPQEVLDRAPTATGGLFFEGQITLTDQNKQRMKHLADGSVNGISIGYVPVREAFVKEAGNTVRELKEIRLFEVSAVTLAMMDAAMATGLKSATPGTETKATGESQDYVRQRLQDALSDAFPYSSTGYDYYGCPMMQGDADGPGCCIRDIYPASVIVFDRDFDALWEIAYSMEANGNVTLGTRQLVKVVYVPVEAGSDESLETMNAKPVSSFKAGRRNSRPDESKLKDAHDALHEVLNMPHHDMQGQGDAKDAADGGSDDASESAKAMALLRKRLAIAQTPAALREVA